MAQIILYQPFVISLVRQKEATRVTQHVRVDHKRRPGALPDLFEQIVNGLARECSSLSNKEKRLIREFGLLANPEPGADRAQFVSLDRMLSSETTLQPSHMNPRHL